MCIRDSREDELAYLDRFRMSPEQKQAVLDRDFNQLIELGAVSYTHLRAHETVLDLVCRLLLEKKKK